MNNLTEKDKRKLTTIAKMLQKGLPDFIKETDNFDEQIRFIRLYGGGKAMFYSQEWYESNEARTKAIYYRTRNQYVKNYRIQEKIMKNAVESAKKILSKVNESVKV